METGVTLAVIFIQILIWGGILALLIYLIIRRMRIKQEEDFEKRDN